MVTKKEEYTETGAKRSIVRSGNLEITTTESAERIVVSAKKLEKL